MRHGFYYISLTYFAQKQRDKKQNKQTNEKEKTTIQTKIWRFGNKANLQHQIFYSQEFYHSTLSILLNINGKERIVKYLKGV